MPVSQSIYREGHVFLQQRAGHGDSHGLIIASVIRADQRNCYFSVSVALES
jgi:hypothetical protein